MSDEIINNNTERENNNQTPVSSSQEMIQSVDTNAKIQGVNNQSVNNQTMNNQAMNHQAGNSNGYSFWAEQAASQNARQSNPGGTYYNYGNQTYQGQGYQEQPQNSGFVYPPNDANGPYSNPYNPEQMRQPKKHSSGKGKRVAKIITGAVLAGVIAGGCFTGVIALYNHFNGNAKDFSLSVSEEFDRIPSTNVLDTAVVPDTDVTGVYEKTLPSIVAIDSVMSQSYSWFGKTYQQESAGSGSGIIVGKTDSELLIATNNHVVDGASKITVTFIDGKQAEGITKGTDTSADLAVVSIDISTLEKSTLDKITVASLGDSDKIKEGEMAIAIGNALGYGQSITVGYISAVNRKVDFDNGSMNLLQTDAAINPGNSGGALLNTNGEVIGINSAKLAADSIEGIGYAIPISYAYPILEELMSREIIKEEDQGFLGVSIRDITEEYSTAYNMPMGVYLYEFLKGSPAKDAGLQERDIITAVDDVEVTTSTSLREKINSYKYGTTVTVTVQRSVDGEYKEMKFDVKLGKKSDFNDDETEEQQTPSEDGSAENGPQEQNPGDGSTVIPESPFDFFPGLN